MLCFSSGPKSLHLSLSFAPISHLFVYELGAHFVPSTPQLTAKVDEVKGSVSTKFTDLKSKADAPAAKSE